VKAIGGAPPEPNREALMMPKKLWYVIADGAPARFVERDEQGHFHTVANFVSTALHKRERALGTDKPGRATESALPMHHAIESRGSLVEEAKQDFIRSVADALASEHGQGRFDRLILVAPPRVLTELKDKLDEPVAESVVTELQKDLTKVPDRDLVGHLASLR
jgi:protein required for attachment to host cells